MIFTCSGGFREAVCKLSGNIARYRALSGRWGTKRAKRGYAGGTFALLRNENKFYKPLKNKTSMALSYSLIKRRNMEKDAPVGSKLVYGSTRTTSKMDLNKLCDAIAAHSTASRGDVMLVLEGLIYILTERLQAGTVVSMGNFGNFRMVAGSVGALTEEEFNTSMFKKPRIIFKPGILLREVTNNAKFEKLPTVTVTVTEQCDKEHVY